MSRNTVTEWFWLIVSALSSCIKRILFMLRELITGILHFWYLSCCIRLYGHSLWHVLLRGFLKNTWTTWSIFLSYYTWYAVFSWSVNDSRVLISLLFFLLLNGTHHDIAGLHITKFCRTISLLEDDSDKLYLKGTKPILVTDTLFCGSPESACGWRTRRRRRSFFL